MSTGNDHQVGGNHYVEMAVEPWDVIDTWPLEQRIGYYRGCALKYTMRMGAKDASIQEIGKGLDYLTKLHQTLAMTEAAAIRDMFDLADDRTPPWGYGKSMQP